MVEPHHTMNLPKSEYNVVINSIEIITYIKLALHIQIRYYCSTNDRCWYMYVNRHVLLTGNDYTMDCCNFMKIKSVSFSQSNEDLHCICTCTLYILHILNIKIIFHTQLSNCCWFHQLLGAFGKGLSNFDWLRV